MPTDPSERPADQLPGDWVVVSAPPFRQRLSAVDEPMLFVPIITVGAVPVLIEVIFGDIPLWGAFLALVGYLALWLGVIVVVTLWRSKVWTNFSAGQLRVGRRVTELTEIDIAVLGLSNTRRVPSLNLQLREGKHIRAIFYLRHRGDVLLTNERQRELLAELLARTSITLPEDPHDPQKKFARYNFPGHVDRDTAIGLVLNPPEAYESLPISY